VNIHTFLVLAAVAEFLAAVSIISTIWIWLTQKAFPSDQLNRNAVGHQVHAMQTSSPDEADDSEASANSSDNRSVEIETDWPPPIQRPE